MNNALRSNNSNPLEVLKRIDGRRSSGGQPQQQQQQQQLVAEKVVL